MREPLQVDVIDANHLAAVNVDDLAIQKVLPQKNEVVFPAQRFRRGFGAQLEGSAGCLQHLGSGNQLQSIARLEDEAGDFARVRAGSNRQIADAAAQTPLRVGDGRSEHGCQGRIGLFVAHFGLPSAMQSNRRTDNPPLPVALQTEVGCYYLHMERLTLLDIAFSSKQTAC